MASIINVDKIQNAAANISVDTTYVVNGSAKAWLNFNQTSTQAIRDSFNVSSISDTGAGRTQVTLTSAMLNNDYMALIGLRMQSTVTNDGSSGGVDTSDGSTSITTTQFQYSYINNASSADADTPYAGGAVHGDLA